MSLSIAMQSSPEIRHDWSTDEIMALFALPFNDLMFQAQGDSSRAF